MWRHCTIAVALAGLALASGCGLTRSTLNTNEAHAAGAVATTLDAPVGRVLAAALDAAGPDFDFDFVGRSGFDFPKMTVKSAQGLKVLNDGVIPAKGTYEAELAIDAIDFGSGRLVGKIKDGRLATLWLLERDHGNKTEISVRIGKLDEPGPSSDAELMLDYLVRIEEKLAHPKGESPLKVSVDFPIARALTTEAQPPAQKGPDR